MSKKSICLGVKYWSDTVIDGIISNQFDLDNEVKKMVLKREPLCTCGRYGTKITFEHQGQLYSFDFLTGYPCQCGQ